MLLTQKNIFFAVDLLFPVSCSDLTFFFSSRTALVTPEPLHEKVARNEKQERMSRKRKETDARKESEDSARAEREKRRRDWELEEEGMLLGSLIMPPLKTQPSEEGSPPILNRSIQQ